MAHIIRYRRLITQAESPGSDRSDCFVSIFMNDLSFQVKCCDNEALVKFKHWDWIAAGCALAMTVLVKSVPRHSVCHLGIWLLNSGHCKGEQGNNPTQLLSLPVIARRHDEAIQSWFGSGTRPMKKSRNYSASAQSKTARGCVVMMCIITR